MIRILQAADVRRLCDETLDLRVYPARGAAQGAATDLDRLREKLEGIVGSDYTAAALAHGPLDITSQVRARARGRACRLRQASCFGSSRASCEEAGLGSRRRRSDSAMYVAVGVRRGAGVVMGVSRPAALPSPPAPRARGT